MLKNKQLTGMLLAVVSAVSVAFLSIGRPLAANATSTTYVADTTTQITVSSLVSGAKYLMCQYAANTSAYEVMNGATTSTKQIPFLTPNYPSLAGLQSGASSLASRYFTLTKESESNWYIQRNSDSQYLVSNGSSDLTFSTSSTYSSTSRSYFVSVSGSSSDYVRFYVYGDTALYLGTKSDKALFDTWHDQTGSTATKDFILYRVYDQDEEAARYASSFNAAVGNVCSSSGNTALSSLESQWTSQSTSWSNLSSAAKSVITSATANASTSASAVAQCKAKYLYILGKYTSDSNLTDFMGISTSSSYRFEESTAEDPVGYFIGAGIFLAGVLTFVYCQKRKKADTKD
jgi:hypothetical protein